MESYVVLAKKNVFFHGIWKSQFKVSESLIKSIATSIPTTPSRACKLLLTSTGLTLILIPSEDGRRGKTDQVSFETLKDILVNQYYPKCLMIIYFDNTNKISVMACSCGDERDAADVSMTFRDRKNMLQHQRTRSDPQPLLHTAPREKQRFFSDGHRPVARENYSKNSNVVSSAFTNGAVCPKENYSFSQRSDSSRSSCTGTAEQEDVFIESPLVAAAHDLDFVFREPVRSEGRLTSFNVCTQTLSSEDDPDALSVSSSVVSQIIKDDVFISNDEIKASRGVDDRSTAISVEEYYRWTDIHRNRHRGKLRSLPESNDGDRDHEECLQKEGTNSEDYDARSVGMQTLPNSKTARLYTKKQGTATTPNIYKEKMATCKKRSVSNTSRSSTSTDPEPGGNSSTSSNTSGSATRSLTRSTYCASAASHNSPAISKSTVRSQTHSNSSGSTVREHIVLAIPGSNTTVHIPHASHQQRIQTGPPVIINRPALINMTSVDSTVVKAIENVYKGKSGQKPYGGRGQQVVVLASSTLRHK